LERLRLGPRKNRAAATGFSGATDCDGIRKTMKYEISAAAFVLQISGARDSAVSVAILPSE